MKLNRETGQIVLMTAITAVVLVGFSGMAIDLGLWLHTRTKLQADADAMALAGALELPNATDSDAKAREWGTKNGVAAGEITSIVVNGTSCKTPTPIADHVTVKLTRNQQAFLAQVLGITNATIKACATAKASSGHGHYAIFANDPCPSVDTLEIPGSTDDVIGAVHSNCILKISGSNNDFDGDTTYTGSVTVGGSGNTFDPPIAPTTAKPWPSPYDSYDDFPCGANRAGTPGLDFTSDTDITSIPGAWLDWPIKKNLKPGVYCSTQKLTLSSSDVTGNVTFVAKKELTVSGTNFHLNYYWNEVLFFSDSTSDSAMDLSGSGGDWEGVMLAPKGRIKFQGSSNISVSGGLLGDRVYTSGSTWNLAALDESSGGPGIQLVE